MELLIQDSLNTLVVSESIFNRSYNKSLIHQVITSYSINNRQGSKSQKNRSKVIGSNKKPWRQKGTGRARSGSVKSPIWRSGGVTFASNNKIYNKKINKRMYKEAIKSILSELVRQNRIIIINEFNVKSIKTSVLLNKVKKISFHSTLIILSNLNRELILSSRNLHKIYICTVTNINPINLIFFKKIILTIDSLKKLEKILS